MEGFQLGIWEFFQSGGEVGGQEICKGRKCLNSVEKGHIIPILTAFPPFSLLFSLFPCFKKNQYASLYKNIEFTNACHELSLSVDHNTFLLQTSVVQRRRPELPHGWWFWGTKPANFVHVRVFSRSMKRLHWSRLPTNQPHGQIQLNKYPLYLVHYLWVKLHQILYILSKMYFLGIRLKYVSLS